MKYLLDTNTVSHILRKNQNVVARLVSNSPQDIAVSSVTYAEICYGLARKPEATVLQRTAQQFFATISVLPFDERIAQDYGIFRAKIEKTGKNLAPMDLMIAAHADSLGAILVTNDQAFFKIDGLRVEDWTH